MNEQRPSTPTTSAAAVIAHNDDVLMEILLLLPAKSLIRFKSVSKHWYSLISDAHFSHLHTLRHRKPHFSCLLRASPSQFFHFNPTSKKFVPFHFNFAQVQIRQSCNGLLLLESAYPHKDYYVYNPTTGESRNLLLKQGYLLGLYLAFDPPKSPHYKVICMRTTSYSIHLFEIEVYDSETHTWKCEENVYSNPPPPLHDSVYCENCIYSLTYDGRVFYFDIEKLMFRMAPLEKGIILRRGGANIFYLMESGGYIHYIAHNDITNSLVVFEIRERSCDWSIRFMFNFDDITASFGAMTCYKICILGIIRGEREEESLVFHFPGKIVVYRFYSGRFEELLDLRVQRFYREGRLQFGYHDAYQFIDSLAPV